MASTPK
jgi:hypothetical protein